MKRFFLSFLPIFCVFLVFQSPVSVSTSKLVAKKSIEQTPANKLHSITTKNNQQLTYDAATHQWIGNIYTEENGKIQPISYQTYSQLIKTSDETKKYLTSSETLSSATDTKEYLTSSKTLPLSIYKPLPGRPPTPQYTFSKQGDSYWYADEQQASDEESAGANTTIQKTWSIWQTDTWNIGVSLDVKSIITISAGFEWSQSLTNGSNYNLPFTGGRSGHVEFRSRMHALWGNLNTKNGSSSTNQYISASTPVKLADGELGGIWYVAYNGNITTNPSFEAGTWSWGDWHPDGQSSAMKIDSDWPFDGTKKLTHWSPTNYQQDTWQVITDVPPGTYYVKVWVRSGGGQNHVKLYVNQFDNSNQGLTYTADLGGQTVSDWNYISLDNIHVTNLQISINLFSDAYAGQWAVFDHVEFGRYGQ